MEACSGLLVAFKLILEVWSGLLVVFKLILEAWLGLLVQPFTLKCVMKLMLLRVHANIISTCKSREIRCRWRRQEGASWFNWWNAHQIQKQYTYGATILSEKRTLITSAPSLSFSPTIKHSHCELWKIWVCVKYETLTLVKQWVKGSSFFHISAQHFPSNLHLHLSMWKKCWVFAYCPNQILHTPSIPEVIRSQCPHVTPQ